MKFWSWSVVCTNCPFTTSARGQPDQEGAIQAWGVAQHHVRESGHSVMVNLWNAAQLAAVWEGLKGEGENED